ncbi:MAG: transcriptional regulator [Hyphomicrobium sp.]
MPDKTRRDKQESLPKGKSNWAALDSMTDDEAEAAARADPDAPPPAENQDLHRAALAKRIRLKLGLSEKQFAERYHIPLITLSAWERHKSVPDAVATAFLHAIAADPEGLAKALARSSGKPEAAE